MTPIRRRDERRLHAGETAQADLAAVGPSNLLPACVIVAEMIRAGLTPTLLRRKR